jgi:hypothetical protein
MIRDRIKHRNTVVWGVVVVVMVVVVDLVRRGSELDWRHGVTSRTVVVGYTNHSSTGRIGRLLRIR